mgnify:CR=1 FL=1
MFGNAEQIIELKEKILKTAAIYKAEKQSKKPKEYKGAQKY